MVNRESTQRTGADVQEAFLAPGDLAMFAKIGVAPELLALAKIERVSDSEARELLAMNGAHGDLSGILFPYFSLQTGFRVGARVRRDNPEIEDSKPKRKYVAGFGDRPHLYSVPGTASLLEDSTVPVILVEAEKSVLALRAWSERTGKRIFPLGLGGCWGWRGRIGKVENEKGERVDEVGPLPDLEVCKKRKVYILLDANAATNPNVQHARRELAKVLRKMKADVHVINLPTYEDVNGPDDFVAARGDDALLALFETRVIINKDGSVRSLLANAITLLQQSPEWSGVLAFNEFSLFVTTQKPAPWQSVVGANWTDYDDSKTAEWMQRRDFHLNTVLAAEAVRTVAMENSFHPVRDYFESLTWDGLPRLETWLTKCLGVPDTPFSRAVGARWLISGVARIFNPGCQADYTLLLEGTQGIKKSTALQTLAGDSWFTDHISDLGNKDSRIELHGKLIVELSELSAVRRGELERVKGFLTARIDNFRPPYARSCATVPRSNIFAATTNDDTPFTDSTGNRRFWPVCCEQINLAALKADRDQLWAEALMQYRAGMPWWLDTDELNQAAKAEQDERYSLGPWDEEIVAWLQDPSSRAVDHTQDGDIISLPFCSSADRVTVTDILVHVLRKPISHWEQKDANQIVRCLTHAGWKRKQDRSRGPDRGKRFYVRPDGN